MSEEKVYVELWMIGWIVGTTKHAKVSVGRVCAMKAKKGVRLSNVLVG